MATQEHDFIVAAITRKIRTEGFDIIYLDGKYHNVSVTQFSVPPKIINHRPDIVGEKGKKNFCIGEAKTKDDLSTQRTRNQIKDFISLVSVDPGNRLFLGIPLSAKGALDNLLSELGYETNQLIDIICIPDSLLPNNEEI